MILKINTSTIINKNGLQKKNVSSSAELIEYNDSRITRHVFSKHENIYYVQQYSGVKSQPFSKTKCIWTWKLYLTYFPNTTQISSSETDTTKQRTSQ